MHGKAQIAVCFSQSNDAGADCANNGNRNKSAQHKPNFGNAPRLRRVRAGWQNQITQFC
jgi:hypothetical protein